jgi:hypothetical protein
VFQRLFPSMFQDFSKKAFQGKDAWIMTARSRPV